MSELSWLFCIVLSFVIFIACVKGVAGFIGGIEAEKLIKEETEKFKRENLGGDTDGKEDSSGDTIQRTGEDV